MTVVFTLENLDKSTIDIEYEPFSYAHSELWAKGIKDFLNSGIPLTDTDRLFNFNPARIDLNHDINNLNILIDKINSQLDNVVIPHVRFEKLQEDVNHVHTNFVESDREAEYTKSVNKEDWYNFNGLLHGLETKFRKRRSKEPQGQIFVELYCRRYPLPEDAYEHFTVKNTFGYCYANYSHVGRHLEELYYANDLTAEDHHIVPMNKISGSSRLWFGDTTPIGIVNYNMSGIKNWFDKNNVSQRINMNWGDPHLAIGWLPVAQMTNKLTKKDLLNVIKLKEISIK
jgi:hypothetical protein